MFKKLEEGVFFIEVKVFLKKKKNRGINDETKKIRTSSCYYNPKSEIGKTTATTHLGVGLVKEGYKNSPQGSQTYLFRINFLIV